MRVITGAEVARLERMTCAVENTVVCVLEVVVWLLLLKTVGSVANGMTVRVSITYTSGGVDVDPLSWLMVMLSAEREETMFNAEVSGQVTRSPEQLICASIVTVG